MGPAWRVFDHQLVPNMATNQELPATSTFGRLRVETGRRGRGVRVVISSGTQLDTERNERKKGAAQAIFHFARQYVKTTTWKPFKMNINCRVKWCGSGVSDGMI